MISCWRTIIKLFTSLLKCKQLIFVNWLCFCTQGLPGGLLPIILPSITNKTRSPCRRVIPGQNPCLLLRTVMMALSDPHRHASILLRYRLCQTKKCLRPFSRATSHRSPTLVCPLSSGSMIRLHTEEFSRRQSSQFSFSGKGWRRFH